VRSVYRGKKVDQKFGLLLFLPKKLPKENNRPIGENSTNPVTLLQTLIILLMD
jgi:hypothetical protein